MMYAILLAIPVAFILAVLLVWALSLYFDRNSKSQTIIDGNTTNKNIHRRLLL